MGGVQFAGYWNSGTFDGQIPAVTVIARIYIRDLRIPGRFRFI